MGWEAGSGGDRPCLHALFPAGKMEAKEDMTAMINFIQEYNRVMMFYGDVQ